MKRVGNTRGFTIIETIIFLTVSSALFVSAMLLVSGQQAKTEFRQAAGEAQSRIDDAINDAATGYYTTNGSLKCDNFFGPSVSAGTTEQGKNVYCTVLGRAVQFRTDTDRQFVYTVVGRRTTDSSGLVYPQTLQEALPNLALATGSYTDDPFPFGLQPYSAYYVDGAGTKKSVQGFAVVSRITSYTAGGSLASGAQAYDLVPIPGGSAGSLALNYIDFRDLARTTMRAATIDMNPPGGITTCMDSGSTDQHIMLRVGVGGSLTTSVEYRDGNSSADTECQV
ncbi:type II secretion system protein [Candidatus Saccharibacteria bacterium]|nr:type II secretion system protein [Candidatus Saccharibacteria bacterium]